MCGSVEHFQKDCPEHQSKGRVCVCVCVCARARAVLPSCPHLHLVILNATLLSTHVLGSGVEQ